MKDKKETTNNLLNSIEQKRIIDKILDYLRIRLNFPFVVEKIEYPENGINIFSPKQNALKNNCGVFRHILEDFYFIIRIYYQEQESFYATIILYYTLHAGASTSCEMPFRIHGKIEGKEIVLFER